MTSNCQVEVVSKQRRLYAVGAQTLYSTDHLRIDADMRQHLDEMTRKLRHVNTPTNLTCTPHKTPVTRKNHAIDESGFSFTEKPSSGSVHESNGLLAVSVSRHKRKWTRIDFTEYESSFRFRNQMDFFTES